MSQITVPFPITRYQDSEGNPIANGYLLIELSDVAFVASNSVIAPGKVKRVELDDNGEIEGAADFWPNTILTPSTTYYSLKAYTESGQLVLGPISITLTPDQPWFGGMTVRTVALTPTDPGNFTVAHGLTEAPAAVSIEITGPNGGQIWFQAEEYDATNLYLIASDGGITGIAQVFSFVE